MVYFIFFPAQIIYISSLQFTIVLLLVYKTFLIESSVCGIMRENRNCTVMERTHFDRAGQDIKRLFSSHACAVDGDVMTVEVIVGLVCGI